MLALSFIFPAGRYHATPWDRHVNEGAVAWPPEPWRIARALIATWHHKVKHTGRHDETTLQSLIESLATELPEYKLPDASHSHKRHYMPQFGIGKTSLIFDAFTSIKRDDPLTIVWPRLELPDEQQALLDDLLNVMGYLGRAESWVEAQRISETLDTNCKPGVDTVDTETGELLGETVTLFAPLAAPEYSELRDGFLTDKNAKKKLGETLPEKLLDALSVETSALRKQGWSQPPAARKVSYLRPVGALEPRYKVPRHAAPSSTSASFILIGKPLPRVEDTLRIGELARIAAMSRAKYLFGEDDIPAMLSGHDLPKGNRHQHAFYLPFDSTGNGRIDRLIVHLPGGMGEKERQAIETLRFIRDRRGREWRVVLENTGNAEIAKPLLGGSRCWQTITPYLHPWHVKKNFSVEEQIRRECRERGLPEPVEIEKLDEITIGSGIRKRRPIHFQRFRSKRVNHQPDRMGSFWRLTFAEPVAGPLALGFACHFGLGLFKKLDS